MQAPKQYRRIVNRLRSRHGKRNGVLSSWALDHPDLERILAKSKRRYRRAPQIRHTGRG